MSPMDRAVSLRTFEAEVLSLKDEAANYAAAKGWTIAMATYPTLSVVLRHSCSNREVEFRLACDDWDEQPPSLSLHHPADGSDLPPQNRSRSCARIRAGEEGVGMARKRYTAEPIIGTRREAEVALAQGENVLPLAAGGRRPAGGPGAAPHGAGARERAAEEAGGRPGAGQRHPQGGRVGTLLRPARRRQAGTPARTALVVSARRACRVLAPPRSTQRHPARVATDEPALIARIIARARRVGRSGDRRITALLRAAGGRVNPKRVERLWRQERLRVPRKAPRRRRLWATDGSCTRRRAERPNHVWSDAFVHERTPDGRALRLLTIVDACTRECLSIDVARRLRADDVLARLTALCVPRGPPASLRSNNGPECTARAVRSGLQRLGVIAPGSPWENGSGESCTGTLRDEGLNPEIFITLPEAQIRIQRWRREYNPVRPHSALGDRPPAPDALEIRPPHPAPWADRRVAALPSALAQQSGAGQGEMRAMQALHELTIVEAGAALREGSVTATALTEAVLARIEATEPMLNAYITVTAEFARAQAAAAEAEAELRARLKLTACCTSTRICLTTQTVSGTKILSKSARGGWPRRRVQSGQRRTVPGQLTLSGCTTERAR